MLRQFVSTATCMAALLILGTANAQTPAPAAAPAPVATPAPAAVAAPPAPAKAMPAASAGADRMEGLAAYYTSKLNGKKTASGKTYYPDALTAAHQTLPFGTKVKVTNTKNKRSVVVTINDRGPTQADRVIDVSHAAASKLGMLGSGTTPVTLEVVAPAPAKKTKA